jgi:hypothetical protein
MAITSKEINLEQLDKELGGGGLIANFENDKEKLILLPEGSDVTESELEEAIKAHKAIDENAIREASRKVILDRIGLTSDEVKILLS